MRREVDVDAVNFNNNVGSTYTSARGVQHALGTKAVCASRKGMKMQAGRKTGAPTAPAAERLEARRHLAATLPSGFTETRVDHLIGPDSMVVAIK